MTAEQTAIAFAKLWSNAKEERKKETQEKEAEEKRLTSSMASLLKKPSDTPVEDFYFTEGGQFTKRLPGRFYTDSTWLGAMRQAGFEKFAAKLAKLDLNNELKGHFITTYNNNPDIMTDPNSASPETPEISDYGNPFVLTGAGLLSEETFRDLFRGMPTACAKEVITLLFLDKEVLPRASLVQEYILFGGDKVNCFQSGFHFLLWMHWMSELALPPVLPFANYPNAMTLLVAGELEGLKDTADWAAGRSRLYESLSVIADASAATLRKVANVALEKLVPLGVEPPTASSATNSVPVFFTPREGTPVERAKATKSVFIKSQSAIELLGAPVKDSDTGKWFYKAYPDITADSADALPAKIRLYLAAT